MRKGRNVECLTDSFVSVQFTLLLFCECFSKKRLSRQKKIRQEKFGKKNSETESGFDEPGYVKTE